MPLNKSAKKRVRQNIRKKIRNLSTLNTFRSSVKEFEKELLSTISTKFSELIPAIEKEKKLTDELTTELEKAIEETKKLFVTEE